MTYSPVSANSPGLGRPLLAFFGALALGQAILTGVTFALPDLNLPSSINVVVAMVAGMIGGQSFAKANARVMTGGEQRRFSLLALLLSIALSVAMLAGLFAWYKVPFSIDAVSLVLTGDASVVRDLGWFFWLAIGIGLLVGWAVIHVGAGMGAKGVIRKMEKDAAAGR